MSKIETPTDIAVISTSAPVINDNYDKIVDAFNNTLSRDGSTPNQMEADIDLNGNDLLNVGDIHVDTIYLQGSDITSDLTDAATLAAAAASSAAAAASSASAAATSAALAEDIRTQIPNWRGAWQNTTEYVEGDLVENSGSTYICTQAHESLGTLNAPGAGFGWTGYWDLFVSKGATGAGTGDVVAANNGSEYVSNAGAFRNNISAMVRAITKRTGLNLATDTTIDSSIYNSDGTNTNGPSGNSDGDSFVSSKIDTNNYNYLWFGAGKAWIGQRISDVNSWVQLLTSSMLAGSGSFIATLTAAPTSGDENKLAKFDGSGNLTIGPDVLDEDDMASDSASSLVSQQSVKAYVDNKVGSTRTWQDVSGARAGGTSYQNTTGRSIQVSIAVTVPAARYIQVSTDNTNWVNVGYLPPNHSNNAQIFLVEDLHYYRINGTINYVFLWAELR